MQFANAHSSDFNLVGRIRVSATNIAALDIKGIVNFPGKLRILVKIRQMRLCLIDVSVLYFLGLLLLFLLCFGGLVVIHFFVYIFLLLLCLIELLDHFRSDSL